MTRKPGTCPTGSMCVHSLGECASSLVMNGIVCGGVTVPLALPLFVLFHSGYWFGNGIMLPVATAMIADVSEVRRLQTAWPGGWRFPSA